MKRFVLKTAVFLIGFSLLAFLLQTVVFSVVRRIPIGGFGIMNAIDDGTINADLIICGSSRGQSHFNPEIIGRETGLSCYNISVNGSRLGVQLPVMKWYLDKNRPPKYAALNIDVFTVEPDPYIYQPYYYLPYLGNENLYEGLARIDRHLWAHRWIPFTNLIFFNKDFQKSVFRDIYHFLKSRQDTLLRGYEANQRPWIGDKWEADHLRRYADGVRYTMSERHKDLLNELMRVFKDKGTQLIFVVSPEYYRSQAILTNRQELIDYYVRLCRENGVWWLDFSDSDLCRDKDLWVNYGHLKAVGADEFSRQFALEFKKRVSERDAP